VKFKLSTIGAIICLLSASVNAQVLISEVMFNPQGSEYTNEFIEIYNRSDNAISLENWLITDGVGWDTLIWLAGPDSLGPDTYGLILDPDYDLDNGLYQGLIPSETSIYTIRSDHSFGSGGLSNSGEQVLLFSPDSLLVSYVGWTQSTPNGYSWERQRIDQPDSSVVWGISLVENGTPGRVNSLQPPAVDLELVKVEVLQTPTIAEGDTRIRWIFANRGLETLDTIQFVLYADENQDAVLSPTEQVAQLDYAGNLEFSAHDSLEILLNDVPCGVTPFALVGIAFGDTLSFNDTLAFSLKRGYPRGVVIINEILYAPTDEQGSEWFELYNPSSDTISLQDWSWADATNHWRQLTAERLLLPPARFKVICPDSSVISVFNLPDSLILIPASWSSLNSSQDSVRLCDATSHLIEQVWYSGTWGRAGTSLERRDPFVSGLEEWNWAPSIAADGGTPGDTNSRLLPPIAVSFAGDPELFMSSTYPPSSVEFQIVLQNKGLQAIDELTLRVNGSFDRVLAIPWQGSLPTWDSLTITGVLDFRTGGLQTLEFQAVLADSVRDRIIAEVSLGYAPYQVELSELLYRPVSNQVEFIEIYNSTPDSLNLQGWFFRDNTQTKGRLPDYPVWLPPGSLAVITSDSAIIAEYSPETALIIPVTPWPALNNSGDSLHLRDAGGNAQLDWGYHNEWDPPPGRSVERKAFWLPVDEISSWGVCQAPAGITPGKPNSISIPPVAYELSWYAFPDSIMRDQLINLAVVVMGTGGQSGYGQEAVLRADGVDLGQVSFAAPAYGDSLILHFPALALPTGLYQLSVITAKDSLASQLIVAPAPGDVIINEFCPWPAAGESEFVELLNRGPYAIPGQILVLSDGQVTATAGGGTILGVGDFGLALPGGAGEVGCPTLLFDPWPGFSNTHDEVVLRAINGVLLDSVAYTETWNVREGASFERVYAESSTVEIENWRLNPQGGTPCKRNWATAPDHNLSLFKLDLPEETVFPGSLVVISVHLINDGRLTGTQRQLTVQAIKDGFPEWETYQEIPSLPAGDSLSLDVSWRPERSGGYDILAFLDTADEITADDTFRTIFFVSSPPGQILLTEIMYQPLPGEPEWVEIYNTNSDTLVLLNWCLMDAGGNRGWVDSLIKLPGNEYLVLASNKLAGISNQTVLTSFPNLNNNEESIYLLDPTGVVVDSLNWNSSWGNSQGVSLERIRLVGTPNPRENWSSCVAPSGSTPGQPNSLLLTTLPAQFTVQLSPAIFSPNGDGHDDEVRIEFQLPVPHAQVSVEVYDIKGRLVAIPARDQSVAHRGVISWDGIWRYSPPTPVGVYLVWFEARAPAGQVFHKLLKVILAP